jgi:hypothetical protein
VISVILTQARLLGKRIRRHHLAERRATLPTQQAVAMELILRQALQAFAVAVVLVFIAHLIIWMVGQGVIPDAEMVR